MIDLSKVNTEKENPRTVNFSSMSVRQAIEVMNQEDLNTVKCIAEKYDDIEKLIEQTGPILDKGGRIIYIGAGTSGRLGLLDAVECPPTFGVDYEMVQGIIAGGDNAFVKAIEGAEDCKQMARKDLENIQLSSNDIVIGIAASGRTPYVIGGLEYAKELGAKTGAIVCTLGSPIAELADYPIEVVPGPEVLTGSTRLKAGTTTKMVLNMISTISMNYIGKIYKNYMVDLKLSNKKLHQRGINIIKAVTDVNDQVAASTLEEADGHVKLAIVMILLNITKEQAKAELEKANNNIENIER